MDLFDFNKTRNCLNNNVILNEGTNNRIIFNDNEVAFKYLFWVSTFFLVLVIN